MYKVDKVFKALTKKNLTPKQIASRFNLANPRDAVFKLRNRGFNIVTLGMNDGKKRNEYELHLTASQRRQFA